MKSHSRRLYSLAMFLISLSVAFGLGEAVLRVKNSSMSNYDIEMWRYSKELKVKTDDAALDFNHVRSKSSVLQNISIRLNEMGLRGGPIEPVGADGRRILFLGGSITLGWGVQESETVQSRLEKMFEEQGEEVQVLNGGVGNYNAKRYVSRFLKELAELQPSDIVVHYFLRDAEDLPEGSENFFLKYSQLGVTLWIAYHRLFDRHDEGTLVDHYKNVYRPDSAGFLEMKSSLETLADYAKTNGIRMYLAITPDVHNLIDYKFGFIHESIGEIAEELGFKFIDLLPAMLGRKPDELWAMPGDPHPNGLGHQLMAEAIFPVLQRAD